MKNEGSCWVFCSFCVCCSHVVGLCTCLDEAFRTHKDLSVHSSMAWQTFSIRVVYREKVMN
jgi:hypothetical protein